MTVYNTIYNADCSQGLRLLDDNSVKSCVTGPPYFRLRDYGVPTQIGLEDTPTQYIENLVAVFRQVFRVLASNGTLWLVIGDTYNAYKNNTGDSRYAGFAGRPKQKKDYWTSL